MSWLWLNRVAVAAHLIKILKVSDRGSYMAKVLLLIIITITIGFKFEKHVWDDLRSDGKESISIPSCQPHCPTMPEQVFRSTSRASAATSPNKTSTHYYKLPFVGPFSSIA